MRRTVRGEREVCRANCEAHSEGTRRHVRRAGGVSEKCAPRSRTAVWVTTKLRLKAARLAMADAIPVLPSPTLVPCSAVRYSSEAKRFTDCDSVFPSPLRRFGRFGVSCLFRSVEPHAPTEPTDRRLRHLLTPSVPSRGKSRCPSEPQRRSRHSTLSECAPNVASALAVAHRAILSSRRRAALVLRRRPPRPRRSVNQPA